MARNLHIPSSLRGRLADVARAHGLGSARDAAIHFLSRGLDRLGAPPGQLSDRLTHVVAEEGYSSEEELLEHLILRGLRAYEEPTASPEALAARLRGLGYID